ncbi:hypothetical protein BC830DRAFT_1119287 [Chytriomyces sp. MP71]|nr:hypothetical protein BC830DRAFT_1119287 [Chytriomyces sp. MP71]
MDDRGAETGVAVSETPVFAGHGKHGILGFSLACTACASELLPCECCSSLLAFAFAPSVSSVSSRGVVKCVVALHLPAILIAPDPAQPEPATPATAPTFNPPLLASLGSRRVFCPQCGVPVLLDSSRRASIGLKPVWPIPASTMVTRLCFSCNASTNIYSTPNLGCGGQVSIQLSLYGNEYIRFKLAQYRVVARILESKRRATRRKAGTLLAATRAEPHDQSEHDGKDRDAIQKQNGPSDTDLVTCVDAGDLNAMSSTTSAPLANAMHSKVPRSSKVPSGSERIRHTLPAKPKATVNKDATSTRRVTDLLPRALIQQIRAKGKEKLKLYLEPSRNRGSSAGPTAAGSHGIHLQVPSLKNSGGVCAGQPKKASVVSLASRGVGKQDAPLPAEPETNDMHLEVDALEKKKRKTKKAKKKNKVTIPDGEEDAASKPNISDGNKDSLNLAVNKESGQMLAKVDATEANVSEIAITTSHRQKNKKKRKKNKLRDANGGGLETANHDIPGLSTVAPSSATVTGVTRVDVDAANFQDSPECGGVVSAGDRAIMVNTENARIPQSHKNPASPIPAMDLSSGSQITVVAGRKRKMIELEADDEEADGNDGHKEIEPVHAVETCAPVEPVKKKKRTKQDWRAIRATIKETKRNLRLSGENCEVRPAREVSLRARIKLLPLEKVELLLWNLREHLTKIRDLDFSAGWSRGVHFVNLWESKAGVLEEVMYDIKMLDLCYGSDEVGLEIRSLATIILSEAMPHRNSVYQIFQGLISVWTDATAPVSAALIQFLSAELATYRHKYGILPFVNTMKSGRVVRSEIKRLWDIVAGWQDCHELKCGVDTIADFLKRREQLNMAHILGTCLTSENAREVASDQVDAASMEACRNRLDQNLEKERERVQVRVQLRGLLGLYHVMMAGVF